jgi:anaphase-promoting complex subunit 6
VSAARLSISSIADDSVTGHHQQHHHHQQQGAGHNMNTNTNTTSPMFQAAAANTNSNHTMSLFSSGNGWSPHKSTTAQHKPRFFESNPDDQNHPAATSTDHGKHKHTGTAPLTLDGIPVHHLRKLSHTALLQSPQQASFYASILYAKTGTPGDAILLAQATLLAKQYTAVLRVLEESGLLQSHYPWEALLLASQALAAVGEWTALTDLLQDACRFPVPAVNTSNTNNNSTITSTSTSSTTTPNNCAGAGFRALAAGAQQQQQPLDDHDDFAWETLRQSISTQDRAANGNSDHDHDGSIGISSSSIHPLARLCCWRGRAYQETGHGLRAATFWKRALRMDCQCQEAWEALLERSLLTPAESHQLIQELDFGTNSQMDWLKSLYLARIELTPQDPMSQDADNSNDTHGGPGGREQQHQDVAATPSFAMHGALDASSIQLSSPIPTFQTPAGGAVKLNVTVNDNINNIGTNNKADNPQQAGKKTQIMQDVDDAFDKLWNEYKLQHCPQVLAMAARRSYKRCDWKMALTYCQELAHLDPALTDASFCYVATLVILGHKRALFRLAHEWVDAAPKSAQAWFAVGAYYFACERYHVAQRHFCRATRLDPQCTEAWIAFGCSFAACDESDQALASFRAAQRLSPGEHSSLLYMGMEYVRTNHLVLAHYFLQSALTASGGDPLCLHELGVLAFQKGEHKESIPLFQRALAAAVGGDSIEETIDLCHDPYWEPTLFNLGHSYRKTRQFLLAATCFGRCVSLCPDKFSAYAALGFTKHMMADLDGAIDYYHQALSCKPDDPFSTEMLNRALREALSTTLRVSDVPTTSGQLFPKSGVHSILSPTSEWARKIRDDSAMSEEMESDVDMSGAS